MTSSQGRPSGCISAVLLYHHLGLSRQQHSTGADAPTVLRRQLDTLLERGWRGTHLRDLIERCRCGLEPSSNQFSVTFDDGYESVYSAAYPALRRLNMTATVFVATGSIGRPIDWDPGFARRIEPLMTADQIRELSGNGFHIGSHSDSHKRLTELSDQELRRELRDSKSKIEDITGRLVECFSYPFGAYDLRVQQAVVEAGYRGAVCMRLGTISNSTNLLEIPRISVRWNTIGAVLLRNIGHASRDCGDV